VVIARGSDADILIRIAHGEPSGTRLLAVVSTLESRKRYILAGKRSSGALRIDDGAAQALARGGSLLPVGVREVVGSFEHGDTVRVTTLSGREVALGLVNYSARDLAVLCGHQSAEIEGLLGYTFGDEVIHRNNMILL
jgi:glutamate 5-kinase